jgi:hypothetical protein
LSGALSLLAKIKKLDANMPLAKNQTILLLLGSVDEKRILICFVPNP